MFCFGFNIHIYFFFQAKEDDFEKFDCVAFINAAENLLTLGKVKNKSVFFWHYQKADIAFQARAVYACLNSGLELYKEFSGAHTALCRIASFLLLS